MRAYSGPGFFGMRQCAMDFCSDCGSASQYCLGYLSSGNAQRAMGTKSSGRPWEGTQALCAWSRVQRDVAPHMTKEGPSLAALAKELGCAHRALAWATA